MAWRVAPSWWALPAVSNGDTLLNEATALPGMCVSMVQSGSLLQKEEHRG
jgi:hypothetical protein